MCRSVLTIPDPPRAPKRADGLAELERELVRFDGRLQGYRSAVDQLTARRARSARRDLALRYGSQIRTERSLEAAARRTTIAQLREFVRRHPDVPRHTPSALLRLAELELGRALEAYDRGQLERPDLRATIAATRRIVVDFPSYRQRDRAASSSAGAFGESDQQREGAAVWRALVCATGSNTPAEHPAGRAPEPTPPSPEHPALDEAARDDSIPATANRYADCSPALGTTLAAEVWLRLGEQHFDAAELSDAIAAYRHVIAQPSGRLFAFGVYKLAWSHYRAGHYALAVERFAQVVQHSDEELRRSGRAGSELRDEAVQYIALTLAYDDWNEDGTPDHAQGGPHPLERLEDEELWPQDRSWSAEVYRRVGQVLFEEGPHRRGHPHLGLRLARYRGGCDRPDVHLSIVRAQRQLGDDESALRTLSQLGATERSSSSWDGA